MANKDSEPNLSIFSLPLSRPSRLLRVQVHPVRPRQRGAALPVAASPGKQRRPAEDQEGEAPAAVRDHQAASQGPAVLQAQRQVHPDLSQLATTTTTTTQKLRSHAHNITQPRKQKGVCPVSVL